MCSGLAVGVARFAPPPGPRGRRQAAALIFNFTHPHLPSTTPQASHIAMHHDLWRPDIQIWMPGPKTRRARAQVWAHNKNVTSRKVIRLSPAHPQRRVAPRSKSRASSRHATLDRLAPLPRRPLVAMPSTRVHATRRQDRGLAGAALPRARAPSFLACCPCSRRRVTLCRSL